MGNNTKRDKIHTAATAVVIVLFTDKLLLGASPTKVSTLWCWDGDHKFYKGATGDPVDIWAIEVVGYDCKRSATVKEWYGSASADGSWGGGGRHSVPAGWAGYEELRLPMIDSPFGLYGLKLVKGEFVDTTDTVS